MAKVNQIVSQATPTYQAENLNQFARDINNIIKSIKALDKNNTEDKNIIISSDPGLKKPEMILNKFKETISLLRNLLEEC